jgi:hypothetical protein
MLLDWIIVSWMKTFFCKDVHMELSRIAACVEGLGVEEKRF